MTKLEINVVTFYRDDLDPDETAYVVRHEGDDMPIGIDLGRVVLRDGQWRARDPMGMNVATVDTVHDGIQYLVDVYNSRVDS